LSGQFVKLWGECAIGDGGSNAADCVVVCVDEVQTNYLALLSEEGSIELFFYNSKRIWQPNGETSLDEWDMGIMAFGIA